MIRFLFGVIMGILLFFFFLYLGGGRSVKKVGEDLFETGKKMEMIEESIKKEKDEVWGGVKKKFSIEEKEVPKKGQ